MSSKLAPVLIFILLIGCAASPVIFTDIKSLSQDEGIVFGRVQVSEEGKEQQLSLLGESKFHLIILPDDSSKAFSIPLKDDGYYAWHLPEGRYTIAGFEWRSHGVSKGRIFANFSVLRDKATYIGTLTIEFAGGRYGTSVTDEYMQSSEILIKRFPDVHKATVRNIMQMENRR